MFFLLIPMILALAVESLLWKRNKLKAFTSLLGNAIWRFVFVVLVFLVFLAIYGATAFYGLTWEVVGFTFLLHVFGVSAVVLWVKTMQNMCVSIADPLSLFRIIPLTILSWAIFGGSLSFIDILLVTLIFISCASLGFFQGRHEHILQKECCRPGSTTPKPEGNFKKGLLYVALWCACFVCMDLILNHMSNTGVHPITFSFLRVVTFLLVVVVLFLIFKKGGRKPALITALKDKNMMLIGLMFAIHSIIFITLLLNMDNVGILSAISVAAIPLVVLCGVFLMKEKIKWYSYIFIAAIVTCVVLLSVLST